ncbi:MAG: orotidine-5'-phosphate decarboxylase, partial [Caldimonas sp.]
VGSTAEQYAREAFERYRADALTLSPFLGFDSIEPYLRHADKGLILLCRTSNPGGSDLQAQRLDSGRMLYEHIAELAHGPWNRTGQLGLVVGATFPDELAQVRRIAPTLPLLIPGVGAQGGDAAATVRAGWRQHAGQTTGPVIVSSSRGILYAGTGTGTGAGTGTGTDADADADFAGAARRAALQVREELARARR